MYTVKEVANMLNLTEHTIRYYANNGLIPTLKRDKNNIRLFDEDSVNWIIFVRHLKNCGMSIKEVKEFVDLWIQGNSTVPIRYEIILEQKEKTREELIDVQNRLDMLEKKLIHYENLMNTVNENTNMSISKIPIACKKEVPK